MDDKIQKALIKNFSKDVVQDAPKGKFGRYVPHHIVTQRLVDVIPGGYDFTYDVIRGKDNAIVGAKCRLYIKATDQTIEEVGDVDKHALERNTESEVLKLAVSDGIKRCGMRIGLGLELWTGGVTEEEFYAQGDTPVQEPKAEPKPKPTPKPKTEEKFLDEDPADMLNRLRNALEFHEADKAVRKHIKDKAWADWKKADNTLVIGEWNEQDFNNFMDLFVQYQEAEKQQDDTELVAEVFGEVTEKVVKKCPKCDKADNITDNREKKANAPEGSGIKRIPDFSCDTNDPKWRPDANGCGWGGYIGGSGDKEVPEGWV
jgi:hypothetical protein